MYNTNTLEKTVDFICNICVTCNMTTTVKHMWQPRHYQIVEEYESMIRSDTQGKKVHI